MGEQAGTLRRARHYFPSASEEIPSFTSIGKQLPPVQAAIERDRLDAQKKALEGSK